MARLISFVLISAAVASMLDLADDADGPMLMQIGAGMVAEKALPEVAEVLSAPKSIFDEMTSGVAKLEQRLAKIQSTNANDVAAQRVAYELNLTTQSNDNSATEDFNAKLEADILKLDARISKLRGESTVLTKHNQGLVAHLKGMQANLTTAQEFIGDALNSGSLSDNASELNVLDELRQHDEARQREDEHTQRLQEVSKGRLLSILELRSATRQRHATRKPAEPDAHGLIGAMDEALHQLADEQNASITSLRQQFINYFEAGAKHRVKLLQYQTELNTTLAADTDLKAKLTAAVEHLDKTKRHLTQRIKAIRSFSKLLGNKPIPEERAVSMLQTGAEQMHGSQAQLPDIKTMLSRPKHAYNHVSQHVSDLADQLDAVNVESIEEAEAQKAEFDKQLADSKRINTLETEEIDKVTEEIAQLEKVITSLRSQAVEITDENIKYRHELETMQANMGLAQESLEMSLKETDEPLAEITDLMVLDELEKNDEAHKAVEAHRKSLSEVSPNVALLQVSNLSTAHDKEGHARGLLKTLSGSLDQLVKEQQASLDALKVDFVQEFGENMKRHDELMEEFSRLNQTRAAKTTLKGRLEVAVAHLTKTNRQLKKRRESFLAFARGLAQRATPVEDASRGSKKRASKVHEVVHKVQETLKAAVADVEETVNADVADVEETSKAHVADVGKAIEGPLDWLKNIAHVKR